MAKKPKGFTSDKQRRAVMALLKEMHTSLSKTGEPPRDWKRLGAGVSRIAYTKHGVVAKVHRYNPRNRGVHADQNILEAKVLRKYGGKSKKVKVNNQTYHVRVPQLLAARKTFKTKEGKHGGSVILVPRVKGDGSIDYTNQGVLRKAKKHFKVNDLHYDNVRIRNKVFWVIDAGVPLNKRGRPAHASFYPSSKVSVKSRKSKKKKLNRMPTGQRLGPFGFGFETDTKALALGNFPAHYNTLDKKIYIKAKRGEAVGKLRGKKT